MIPKIDYKYAPMAMSVAMKFKNVRVSLEDRFMTCLLKAIEAVKNYDRTLGVKESAYVYTAMVNAMREICRYEKASNRTRYKTVHADTIQIDANISHYDDTSLIMVESIMRLIKNKRNREIFIKWALEGYSLHELSIIYKVTRQRISQIILDVRAQLKEVLHNDNI